MGSELEQEVDTIETSVGTSDDEASSSGSLWARVKYALANMVKTSDAQTIAGVKTFSSSPVIPTTPDTTTSAVNQAYVESTVDGVNNIAHKSGDEEISGTKKFTGIIDVNGFNRKHGVSFGTTWRRYAYCQKGGTGTLYSLLVMFSSKKPTSAFKRPLMFGVFSQSFSGGINYIVHTTAESIPTSLTNNVVIVRKVEDDTAEIWVKDADTNYGYNICVLDEYNIGGTIRRWVVDNETTDANFDPTDTTKYSDYKTGEKGDL